MYIHLRNNLSTEFFDNESKDKKVHYYLGDFPDPIEYFGPLDNVNIFVGANNSGKSRFLRGLLKQQLLVEYKKQALDRFSKKVIQYCSFINSKIGDNNFGFNAKYESLRFESAKILPPQVKDLFAHRPGTAEYTMTFDRSFFEKIARTVHENIKTASEQKELDEIKKYLKKCSLEINVLLILDECVKSTGVERSQNKINRLNQNLPNALTQSHIQVISSFTRELLDLSNYLDSFYGEFSLNTINPPLRMYVPVLRSSSSLYNNTLPLKQIKKNEYHNFQKIETNILEFTVFKNYGFGEEHYNHINVKINTGLELYKDIKKVRNSRRDQRDLFDAFEEFLENNFFNGKEVEIITLDTEQQHDQHISVFINGEERDIHDLGDGIQSIILMMYPIFIAPKGSWIFLEEPEIHLHPGLQRIFLDQIINNTTLKEKGLRYFITTHSNHLLDISLTQNKGISIFTFDKIESEKKRTYQIRNVKSTDIDILGKLEVNNSSVFISNCSIWVEGITDRKYIKTFLREYCREKKLDFDIFKEDIHYSFFEYGGSNIAHYVFYPKTEVEDDIDPKAIEKIRAQFLSNKIFLIADKDKNKDPKHSLLGVQASKNFHYEVLPVLEIENLLSSEHLEILLPKLSKKITAGEIAGKIDARSYKGEYLAKYLIETFNNKITFPLHFSTNSGTLSNHYKMRLANLTEESTTWELMSEPARNLTEKIYNFIKGSNYVR